MSGSLWWVSSPVPPPDRTGTEGPRLHFTGDAQTSVSNEDSPSVSLSSSCVYDDGSGRVSSYVSCVHYPPTRRPPESGE